jgi:hypothetical protein
MASQLRSNHLESLKTSIHTRVSENFTVISHQNLHRKWVCSCNMHRSSSLPRSPATGCKPAISTCGEHTSSSGWGEGVAVGFGLQERLADTSGEAVISPNMWRPHFLYTLCLPSQQRYIDDTRKTPHRLATCITKLRILMNLCLYYVSSE